MDIINNTPDSIKPVKKQWKEPEIFLIGRNDVETKNLPYIKEHTGKYVGKTFFNNPGTLSTVGSGKHHKSLIS